MNYKIFNINKKDIVVVTGAGGKTSLIFSLAEKLSKLGKVLITTTTKMYKPSPNNYEFLKIESNIYLGNKKNITVIGNKEENNKITSLSYKEIQDFQDNFDYILIEGDGAKEKIIKFWNDSEPCIPKFATKIIGVINSEIFNLDFNENNTHRYNLSPKKLLKFSNKKIDSSFLSSYILDANFFKNCSLKCERYIFFNGIDGNNKIEKLKKTLETTNILLKNNYFINIVLGSIKNNEFYPFQKVDAVVMASGFSNRMKTNKLKLKYNNLSFLEICLKNLSSIPFNEIIVCGREKWSEELSKKYNFKYLYNFLAHKGQSESIKLGVKNSKGDGIVFFTADQPFLKEKTILELYYNFLKTNIITIPTVNNNRFSPVFFPENKKCELLSLNGDTGGKNIIKTTPILNFVKFSSELEFFDIDTEIEFQFIKNLK